jgi:hypothetical protein
VAYQLGATLQQRLGIPFELHYDAGHPQSDLSWTETLERSPLTTVASPANANSQALGQSQPPLANQRTPQNRTEPDQARSLQEQTAAERQGQDAGPPRSQRVDPPRSPQEQPQPSQAAAMGAAWACATPSGGQGTVPGGSDRVADCPPDGGPPLTPTPVAASSVSSP